MFHPVSSSSGTFSPPPPTTAASSSKIHGVQPAPQAQFKSLAIEGSIKQGDTSVALKLFAKVAVPRTSSQQIYALFPECRMGLRNTAVHPLDANQTPYAFPPDASPLLLRATRALGTKPALNVYYKDALTAAGGLNHLNLVSPARANGSSRPDKANADISANIVVQNFTVSLVTPKYPMPRSADSEENSDRAGSDVRTPSRRRTSFGAMSTTPSRGRFGSTQEKKDTYYIIAIELLVPFAGEPPDSPYMIYLPTPVCLQNKIRLRLPPIPLGPSGQEDEDSTWNIQTTPLVTQSPWQDSNAISDSWADDEDGELDGRDGDVVIQGSFPATTETGSLVVRWTLVNAEGEELDRTSPPKSRSRSNSTRSRGNAFPNASRKRVRIQHVQSSATYTVHPLEEAERVVSEEDGDKTLQMRRFLPVDVEYSARCVGFSHPGVETELAVELNLDPGEEGAEVDWAEVPVGGHTRMATGMSIHGAKWDVVASGTGFKGFERAPLEVVESRWAEEESPRALRRERTDSPTPGAGRSTASFKAPRTLAREDTVLTEASESSESRRSLSRNGSSSHSDALGSDRAAGFQDSLTRAPLPGPAVLDAEDYSFESSQLIEMELGPSASHRQPLSQSRESSGPISSNGFSSSASSYGQPLSRTGSNESDGSLNAPLSVVSGDSMVATPTTMSGYTNFADSPYRPRSRALSQASHSPSNPLLLNVDLLALLAAQRVPNPAMAEFSFSVKGRIIIAVPEGVDEATASVRLPMWRFPLSNQQECQVNIVSGSRGLKRHFEVSFASGEDDLARDPMSRNVEVASRLLRERKTDRAEVVLAIPLPRLPSWRSREGGSGSPWSSSALQSKRVETLRPPPTTGFPADSDLTILGLEHENLHPADDLQMPSPFASRHASEDDRGRGVVPSSAVVDVDGSTASISRVEINILVSPPNPSAKGKSTVVTPVELGVSQTHQWSYLVHVRATWPFQPGSENASACVEFGLPKPRSFDAVAPRVEMLSAHLGNRAAAVHMYHARDVGGTMIDSQDDNGTLKWQAWVKIPLPSRMTGMEGDLDFIYQVSSHSTSRRKVNLDLLLPSFTLGIARVKVAVDEVQGYACELLQSDYQPVSSSSGVYRSFVVQPGATPRLSFVLSKPSLRGRLVPTRHTAWQGFVYAFAIALVGLVLSLMQDVHGIQQALQIPATPLRDRFSGVAQILHGAPNQHPQEMEAPTTFTTPVVPEFIQAVETPTRSPTLSRRMPKETLEAPDGLWGDDQSVLLAPRSSSLSTVDAPEAVAIQSTSGSSRSLDDDLVSEPAADSIVPLNMSGLFGAWYSFGGGDGALSKHRHRAWYFVKGFLRKGLGFLLAILNFPN